MDKGIRYPRRQTVRLTLLIPVVVAIMCLIASRAYITSVGGTYDYVIDCPPGSVITKEDVVFEPPRIVAVRSVQAHEDGATVVTFEALEDGAGIGKIRLPNEEMKLELRVQDGLIIVDRVNFSGWESIQLSLILVALLTGALFVWAFVRMLRDAWFGYEMAAYAGAGIFFCVQALTFLHMAIFEPAQSFADLANSIVSIANRFVVLVMIPMTVIAILVVASNVALMRHEGKGATNALGVLFLLAFVGACVVWRFVADEAFRQLELSAFVAWWLAGALVAVGISFALALLLGTSLTAWLAALHEPDVPRDYVIILGCGLRPDGSPTPLLAGRVEAARAFARRQEEAGFRLPTLVPSGGKGSDERWSEAEAMVRYLRDCDDPCRVVLEDKSTNTRENMSFSYEKICEDAIGKEVSPQRAKIAFATTNYHVLRGYVHAHASGFAVEGIAAKTKLYFWPNAFLREFVGLVVTRAVPILVALACVELLYVLAFYVTMLGGM